MSTRKPGKIIDTVRHVANGRLFQIPVRLVRAVAPNGSARYEYAVHMDDPYVRVEHTDPAEAIRLARDEITTRSALTWARFLYVTSEIVRGPNSWAGNDELSGGLCAVVRVQVQTVMLGTDSAGGTTYSILAAHDDPFSPERNARPIHRGLPEVGEKKNPFSDGRTCCALLPYTPERYEALHRVVERLRGIGDFLNAVLHPSKITDSLSAVDSTLRLGSAAPAVGPQATCAPLTPASAPT